MSGGTLVCLTVLGEEGKLGWVKENKKIVMCSSDDCLRTRYCQVRGVDAVGRSISSSHVAP